MGSIHHQRSHYAECNVHHILCGYVFVVFACINRRVRSGQTLTLLTLFEEFGAIHLKHVNFFTHISNVLVNHDQGLLVPLASLIFYVYLHQQFPSLLLLSEPNCMVTSGLLLTANLNSCVDIEYWLLVWFDCQEVFNFCLFVLFNVAVQKQCCVVFVVVV